MILHTGNRTDIPAFYSKWFSERLRAGYALVRNPYDPRSVTRYDINPEVVDLIVFCTKNPGPTIGSGGATGLGLGNSRQKHLFVPEPQNDFIFSIVCEELGFVGACAVVLLFVLLLWRGITIAAHAPDRFGALLVTQNRFDMCAPPYS